MRTRIFQVGVHLNCSMDFNDKRILTMLKRKFLTAVSCVVLPLAVFAANTNTQSSCDGFTQRTDYVFASHHEGVIPKQFVGSYTYGTNPDSKGYATFTLGAQGHAQGKFARAGKLVDWYGTVVGVGKDLSGDGKLLVHYVISRETFGEMNKTVVRTIDTPGKLFITAMKGNDQYRLVDTIGYFENYVSLGQRYQFKQA